MRIVFDPFWKTLRKKGISQYRLIRNHHVSAGQLDRVRKNEHVSTHTLEQFCEILDCGISDIIELQDDNGNPLPLVRMKDSTPLRAQRKTRKAAAQEPKVWKRRSRREDESPSEQQDPAE